MPSTKYLNHMFEVFQARMWETVVFHYFTLTQCSWQFFLHSLQKPSLFVITNFMEIIGSTWKIRIQVYWSDENHLNWSLKGSNVERKWMRNKNVSILVLTGLQGGILDCPDHFIFGFPDIWWEITDKLCSRLPSLNFSGLGQWDNHSSGTQYSLIQHGPVQRFQKLIYLHLLRDCFVKISPQYKYSICSDQWGEIFMKQSADESTFEKIFAHKALHIEHSYHVW